ncbi:MAG TPA: cyclic beta 1-2 glucan synthetase, partial [Polyangia bacterium]
MLIEHNPGQREPLALPARRLAATFVRAGVGIPALHALLARMFSFWHRSTDAEGPSSAIGEEQPLRAELLSVDQLAQYAARLAASHKLADRRRPDRLIPRLDDNERILVQTHHLVTAAVARNRRIAPAGEWLLDNFYLIEEQIRVTRRNLPRAYSRELPQLSSGPDAGYPRAYAIALELIAHVDGRLDVDSLNSFVGAYKPSHPLHLGELWAIPIMLGLALVENLRRVAAHMAAGRRDCDLADDWAERMVEVVQGNPNDLILVLADLARANPPLTGAFLGELTRHLQGQSAHFTFANSWLEHRLAEHGQTTERLILAEGQAQAADQISMGNCITSLRFLGANDWRDFVETHSLVERTLRTDPAHVYAAMDFSTRDRYRHRIEEIAKRSALEEHEVAREAVGLAHEAAAAAEPDHSGLGQRGSHVGYYLVDRGLCTLELRAKTRPSLGRAFSRFGARWPLFLYLFSCCLVTTGATAAFTCRVLEGTFGLSLLEWCVLVAPLALCATHLGVAFTNWLVALLATARRLPRMDFSAGIPEDSRTIVVVPSMLSNAVGVKELLEGLEVRYLANRDQHLHFALLTDFVDAAEETLPADAELVGLAREGIAALNRKYGSVRQDIFLLFHRPRRWNSRQGVWMGHERKRGKLGALNAFLRSGRPEAFSEVLGDTSRLSNVRYVITLDSDTQLPRDAAREMVGAMAHTLNRPVFDPRKRRVVEGYGILQPRVSVSLPSAQRSWFVRLFAGDPGVDPYTRVVSDVYQDLFGEGSFVGKGIYDVDAFVKACADFPEDTVLSHDLLEGAHARSALMSDVELFEAYPSRYLVDVSRRHRWIRGDWQIAGWLLPRVSRLAGGRAPNPIAALSWWKIFDNLRRSLVPVATLMLLLSSFLLLAPRELFAVIIFVVSVFGTVPLVSLLTDLARKPSDLPLAPHLRVAIGAFATQAARLLFTLAFISYDAYVSFDAIVRTTARLLFTRRHLLEWTTASDAQASGRTTLLRVFTAMLVAPVLTIEALALIIVYRPASLAPASPFLGLWFVSPAIGWWLSRTLPPPPIRLSGRQRAFLSKLARKTWRFFETFVTAEENWLPPDNVQEHTVLVVAPRTSPTNVGIALLANLTATDFGYASVAQLLERTGNTLATLFRMERYRGHFLNWYDTRTLEPLRPQYVSTVDSGNLVGHLLVLRSGLLELCDAKPSTTRAFDGLRDTVQVLRDLLRVGRRIAAPSRGALGSPGLRERIQGFERLLEPAPRTLTSAAALLSSLTAAATELSTAVGADEELKWWTLALERTCRDHHDDLLRMAPWTDLSPLAPDLMNGAAPPRLPHLTALYALVATIDAGLSSRQSAALPDTVIPALDQITNSLTPAPTDRQAPGRGLLDWCGSFRGALVLAAQRATERIKALEDLAAQCQELTAVDYTFLFDKSRDLFAIGYNVSDRRLDGSFYDLLASEARLASFVAIAQSKVDQEHWFALGRMLTTTGGAPALLSWSGSMFEYLMPLLVMPTYENTLLERTYKAVVRRQIDYGNHRGVPWGISESGYNTVDPRLNYQYRAFGVPGLGL